MPGPAEVLHFKGDLTGAKGYAEDAVKLSVSQLAVFLAGEIHGFSMGFPENSDKMVENPMDFPMAGEASRAMR